MPDSSATPTESVDTEEQHEHDVIVDLIPVIRRVVAARVRDHQLVDDLVQETLARVMTARHRIEDTTLAPYAVATARNLVGAVAQGQDKARRKAHLLLDDTPDLPAETELLREEEGSVVGAALSQLPAAERELLLAHEVEGAATAELAAVRGTTAGAVAAQLNRSRAKLRVEYLLADGGITPPTDRCRPVLYALSGGDRRRQTELDAAGHVLECDSCLVLSTALFDRRPPQQSDDEARVLVSVDADVVTARLKGRDIATRAGFTATDLTLISTAISEIARNIVKFAERGEIVIRKVDDDGRRGVSVVARDVGPGISDLGEAMRDGVSTYRGLGLGLPGARRLMDEFDIVSEVGKGTTVTMAKWLDAPPVGHR